MFKKFLLLIMMLCFAGCAAPTSALLGPTITGAATDSLARASLSYTSNIMMTNLKQSFFDKSFINNSHFHK